MAKVVFLQEGIYENLGIMYVSAALKKSGNETLLLISSLEQDLMGSVVSFSPDIVCFGVMTGSHLWAYETAGRLKKILPRALMVIGGPHATFFPESIMRYPIDIACVGEGEQAMAELADAYGDFEKIRTIGNLRVKENDRVSINAVRPLIEDLDLLVFPDRSLYYKYSILAGTSRKAFITTRGCPYDCTFCFNHQLKQLYRDKGRYVRRRSAGNVIAEILEVKRQYSLNSVYFQDDTFVLDKSWLFDFLARYREQVGLPFNCLVRADLCQEDVIKALKEAGCTCVHFGIECGDEKLRNEILKKNLSDQQIISAAALLKKYDLTFKTFNIVSLPGETVDQAIMTLELNAKISVDLPWVSIMTPYPKTDIATMMEKKGLITELASEDDIAGSFFANKPKTKIEKEMANLHHLFFWGVKYPVLIPLIRRLIKLPPNPFFNVSFYLGELWVVKTSENLQWLTAIRMGIDFVRINFLKKQQR